MLVVLNELLNNNYNQIDIEIIIPLICSGYRKIDDEKSLQLIKKSFDDYKLNIVLNQEEILKK